MGNKSSILDEFDNKQRLYKSFASEVEHQLNRIISEKKIPCNAITYRLKDRDSLISKIDRKKNKYTNLNEITDIAGVRVITYYTDDVDKVAQLVEQEFAVDKENSIDKREALEPDRFGYCSVHYVVEMSPERLNLLEYKSFKNLKCEIQIRSVLQHAWAEIEHDLGYKSEKTIPKNIRRDFSRLAGLLEIADEKFQEIRQDLNNYKDEIAENIASNEIKDIEIDAILLDELLNTDNNLKRISNILEDLSGRKLNDSVESLYYESTINELNCLNVYTISQLRSLIDKGSDYAIEIAKRFLSTYKAEHINDDTAALSKTVAYFYLCYAGLLINELDFDSIVKFLYDNSIGEYQEQEALATELLQIKKELSI